MSRARSVCSQPGCPNTTPSGRSRCTDCDRAADRARGTAAQRGYDSKHRKRFRTDVLRRDPICVLCGLEPSTVADHYPRSRRELIDAGLDPNDPQYGRGLGKRCHDRETAKHQPGGWHAGVV